MNWLFEQADFCTPDLHLQLRVRAEVTIEDLPSGAAVVRHPWGAMRLDGVSATAIETLKRLNSGWISRSNLWPTASGNLADLASISERIWVLDRISFLCSVRLVLNDRLLATAEPVSYGSRWNVAVGTSSNTRMSRFAYLQRHNDGLAMESAVAAHRVILHGEWGAAFAGGLARGVLPEGEAVGAAIALLDAAGMLDGREPARAPGVGDDLLAIGEFHDLLFHHRSRFGLYDAPFGAQFPYRDNMAPLRAIPGPLQGETVALAVPREEEVRARDISLTEALEGRASIREYSKEPLSMAELGEFLFRCARVRARYGPNPQSGMPYEATDRPYPSGGAMHDLELYLIVTDIQDLPTGAFHYAADRHLLETFPAGQEDVAMLLEAATRASGTSKPPHVLIKIVSRFARLCWKYRSISYATTLKNVGVLYQTMYLVATSMRLAGCALGSGDDVAAERALKLSSRSEIVVGEFMLGSPAPGATGQVGPMNPTWVPLVAPYWGRK
jgi:SagB-type dehydrogenase family enzyme